MWSKFLLINRLDQKCILAMKYNEEQSLLVIGGKTRYTKVMDELILQKIFELNPKDFSRNMPQRNKLKIEVECYFDHFRHRFPRLGIEFEVKKTCFFGTIMR